MKPEIGIGNVTVKLTDADGSERDLVLKPSIHAVRMLSRKYGGLQPLVDRVSKLDFDVMIDILELGAQIAPNSKSRAELELAVYNSGLSDFSANIPALCIKYITILVNGGRPLPDDPEEAASEGNPTAA